VLAPALVVAYIIVLLVDKKWHWQAITVDFKPQTTFACIGLTMAILVLTAVATAVSTRLGQVMTIVVCAGVFVFGLLSNYLIGRHAFKNDEIGIIGGAESDDVARAGWDKPGDGYTITLRSPPTKPVRPGDSFYYSTSPSGFPMLTAAWPAFTGDPNKSEDLFGRDFPALVVTSANGTVLKVRKGGTLPLSYFRPPQKDDYVFLEPTKTNPFALAVWGIAPNMQCFWLLDAVSQNQQIPPAHMLKLAGYSLAQIVAFLSLGVVLFQRRDVG